MTYSTFLAHSGGLLRVMKAQLVKIVHMITKLNIVRLGQGIRKQKQKHRHKPSRITRCLKAYEMENSGENSHDSLLWCISYIVFCLVFQYKYVNEGCTISEYFQIKVVVHFSPFLSDLGNFIVIFKYCISAYISLISVQC